MNEKERYAFELNVKRPWRVTKAEVGEKMGTVMVSVVLQSNAGNLERYPDGVYQNLTSETDDIDHSY